MPGADDLRAWHFYYHAGTAKQASPKTSLHLPIHIIVFSRELLLDCSFADYLETPERRAPLCVSLVARDRETLPIEVFGVPCADDLRAINL